MKHRYFIYLLLLILIVSLTLTAMAGNADDITMNLHEGVVIRMVKEDVRDLAFSPDGKYFAVASSIGIWLYDTSTYDETTLLEVENRDIGTIVFSSDGKLLATGSNNGIIELWSVYDKRKIAKFNGSEGEWNSLAFSPDGQILASGQRIDNYQRRENRQDNIIKLWSISNKREIAMLKGHTNAVDTLVFSPDGRLLASGSRDATIKLWSVPDKREISTLGEAIYEEDYEGAASPPQRIGVYSIKFSPDGKLLASANSEESVDIWSISEERGISYFNVGFGARAMGTLWAIAFSSNMEMVASGHWDGTIKLWSISEKREIASVKGHGDGLSLLAFSPDGQTLVTGTDKGTIKFWSISKKSQPSIVKTDDPPSNIRKSENVDDSSTPTLPPIIKIEDIKFSEKVLDAGETATLSIRIKNVGSGDARDLTIELSSNMEELVFPQTTDVPTIPKKVGEQTVHIQIKGGTHLPTDKARIDIYLIEPHFVQRIPGKLLTFETRKFPTPKLVITE